METQGPVMLTAVKRLALDAVSVSPKAAVEIHYPSFEESQQLLRDGTLLRAFKSWGGQQLSMVTGEGIRAGVKAHKH